MTSVFTPLALGDTEGARDGCVDPVGVLVRVGDRERALHGSGERDPDVLRRLGRGEPSVASDECACTT